SGTLNLGNARNGVDIFAGASGNLIGGTTPAAGNTIAFNAGAGVAIYNAGTVGNQIRGNSIFANAGLGIDLGGDGVTANDSAGHLTATATSLATGDTSEFSAAVTINASAAGMPDAFLAIVNALTGVTQFTQIVLDLGGGTYSTAGLVYDPRDPDTAANVQLI